MINTVREFPLLLQNHLQDILFQEASNDRYMYLYYADRYWTAFERSAFQLRRLYPDAELIPMKLSLASFPILLANVRQDDLHKVVKRLACRKATTKERVYAVERIRNLSIYNKWHNEETRELQTMLDQLHLC